MNVVICGAGEVGRYAAEVFATDAHSITVIDRDAAKLDALEQTLDVRVLRGDGTHAEALREAAVHRADLYLAATHIDETNLLSASIARGVGARRTIARVHHSAFFEGKGLDYAYHLGIDHLVCPEYTTAVAIAQTLRNPAALAVERFARGEIEVQQFPVSPGAPAVGKVLAELRIPVSARLATIERDGVAFIPDRQTVVHEEDVITLVGAAEGFARARKLFQTQQDRRKHVVVFGGSPMAVWLCRQLRRRDFAVRLYVLDRPRSEELAAKLDWVTVVRATETDSTLFEEDRIGQADAFVALTDDDEQNILTAGLAKSLGVKHSVAVLQRATYLHLIRHVGIDRAFSPRSTAVQEMRRLLDDASVHRIATLAVGIADVFEVRVSAEAGPDVLDKPLRDVKLPARTIVGAVQRDDQVFVPGATDQITAGDTLVVFGPADAEAELRERFGYG